MLDTLARVNWCISNWRELPSLRRLLNELRHERTLSVQQWQELRNRRLRAILLFARDHVPYYRRLFDQCGFDPDSACLPADLGRIPLLTKNLVREHTDELIADNVDRSALHQNASGGSTGVPLKFFQDRRYRTTARALEVYYREWWGLTPHDRTARIWGGNPDSGRTLRQRFYQRRHRIRYLDAFRMNGEQLLNFARTLAGWRPAYLVGYASALEVFARCVREHAVEGLRFRVVRAGAETLWPHQRQLIEETFQSPVYDFYASREVNIIATECPEERRMHLISTWRYLEVVDEEGKPVPDGARGSIVVTDLSNYGMPFIRYRNEDAGALAKEPCPCGRPSPVLDRVLGRHNDVISSPSGEMIHGQFFAKVLYQRGAAFRQFQVYQPALTRVLVRYVPAGANHEATIAEVLGKIQERMGAEVTVEAEVCDQIPQLPNGKYRFVYSDVARLNDGPDAGPTAALSRPG